MKTPLRLVDLAHQRLGNCITEGGLALDATAGNGLDTCFLAKTVGRSGKVLAIDIQNQAIGITRAALQARGLARRVTLACASHAQLAELLPCGWHGSLKAAMFNLGYLPRGSRHIATTPATTIPALVQALDALAPGGILSIICYNGHRDGPAETAAVRSWAQNLPPGTTTTEWFEPVDTSSSPPELLLVSKNR